MDEFALLSRCAALAFSLCVSTLTLLTVAHTFTHTPVALLVNSLIVPLLTRMNMGYESEDRSVGVSETRSYDSEGMYLFGLAVPKIVDHYQNVLILLILCSACLWVYIQVYTASVCTT